MSIATAMCLYTCSKGKHLPLLNGKETDNYYTEVINGVNRFTSDKLELLVKEMANERYSKLDINSFKDILVILQKTLKINFVIFDMSKREDMKFNVGDIVLYKDKPVRIINISKDTNNTYELYNGYKIIENVKTPLPKPILYHRKSKDALNKTNTFTLTIIEKLRMP